MELREADRQALRSIPREDDVPSTKTHFRHERPGLAHTPLHHGWQIRRYTPNGSHLSSLTAIPVNPTLDAVPLGKQLSRIECEVIADRVISRQPAVAALEVFAHAIGSLSAREPELDVVEAVLNRADTQRAYRLECVDCHEATPLECDDGWPASPWVIDGIDDIAGAIEATVEEEGWTVERSGLRCPKCAARG